ncbi:threonine/serine exporter family protein [Halonatronum saccharophilum]|uniref:threonine/serine exporter family protein n=1 Tax=Halonatronum saccharophilum TaxID=150060 RepID=UPI00047F92F9|nr:threonine/serine exporter family protein [Halonatronum saccharophilum]
MNIIFELISAFIIVLTFGAIFESPKRSLWLLGLTGAISWGGFLLSQLLINQVVISAFIASIIVGICGEIFARVMKLPVTVFVVCGIIPLVPGVPAYDTMLHLINGDYIKGVERGVTTLLIAGSIAFAVAIVGAFSKYFTEIRMTKN